MKPRKHAELIKAWADGAEIEYYAPTDGKWTAVVSFPSWSDSTHYRIKPQPKPDVVRAFRATTYSLFECIDLYTHEGNLVLTFSGETGELKSAEVIK